MQPYELSHWEWESFFRDIDVLVIGSGIVGLTAAIHLKEREPRLKVVVVDRGALPLGASTRNAGFACFGSLSELLDDLEGSPRDAVLALVEQRYRGLLRLRERYGDAAIGYEPLGGYEVFRDEDEALYERCMAARATFNADLKDIVGEAVYVSADDQLPHPNLRGIRHLIRNSAEGQLHTGMLMRTMLARAQALGVEQYGGITVAGMLESASGVHLQTAAGWVFEASRVLVATNGFATQLMPDLAVVPARNQVLITAPIPGLALRGAFHYDKGYVYFRNVGDRILLGGGRNQDVTGETSAALLPHYPIRDYLTQLLHNLVAAPTPIVVERWWSGIMGVGAQKKPIVQAAGRHTVVAVRMGGMGVAIGTQVGESAADMLLE